MIGAILRTRLVVALVAFSSACIDVTDGGAAAVNMSGAWEYTATQTSPSADLTGVLTVSSQDGELLGGSVSWEERTGPGTTRLLSGAVSGRLIGTDDVDFDVLLSEGTRRHVGRLVADTIRGTWVQIGSGTSGEFVAVRGDQ
ncbi:MAG TPA: hypothetical protein VJR92_08310 [Gemmatimonadaceae bacterium]|nr:hypothetical protein [Gemmatimonadaceae bacterium]